MINPNMVKRIQRMALKTWDIIGNDVLSTMEEEGLDPILDQSEVIECVCDASYMFTHGRDKEAYKVWNNIKGYENQIKIIRDAFPHMQYGW